MVTFLYLLLELYYSTDSVICVLLWSVPCATIYKICVIYTIYVHQPKNLVHINSILFLKFYLTIIVLKFVDSLIFFKCFYQFVFFMSFFCFLIFVERSILF